MVDNPPNKVAQGAQEEEQAPPTRGNAAAIAQE
jgi:hypothetical protein